MADTRARTAIWKGLNRMPYIGDGEMRNMKNLSSDAYPFITTRKGRKPYTFTTHIPSPEGEAYVTSVEMFPEPCEAECGNVYKLTTDAVETSEYTSGSFYYWNGSSWREGSAILERYWLGYTKTTVKLSDGAETLVSANYVLPEYSSRRYPEGYNNGGDNITYNEEYCEGDEGEFVWCRYKVKYLGQNTEFFKTGKTYAYCVYVKAHWKEGSISNGNSGGNVSEMPAATASRAASRYYYKYTGETTEEFTSGTIYGCVVSGNVYWEECEEQYTAVEAMPETPAENQQVRFISKKSGAPILPGYYYCEIESDSEGNLIYFYKAPGSASEYTAVGYLPTPSAENAEMYYLYAGPAATGEFAECYYNESFYDWKVVEHPNVARTVTLQDYLDNYDGSGLSEILEIGAFSGNLAALIRDASGNTKLYYNQKLYGNVNSVSEECGKKLATVGSRLVVGESGSYLHVKDGETTYFSQAGSFSYTLLAEKTSYGLSGKYKYPSAYGSSETGHAVFEFWSGQYYLNNPLPGRNYEMLAEALSVAGTGFVVYGSRSENSSKQYLKVTSVTYEPQKLLIGYSNGYNDEYADYLRIEAEGVVESFNWNVETRYDNLTFESTDPHYYDVVAWKKRLWGYHKNVMYGTAADIFDENGLVDWNRGDNTNMEAIAQPLWQGGDITGIAALMSGLVYFKEDCITIVTGNYPAIMSSNTIPCRGLPPENRRSVAVANESVYYLSTDGVYRFDGGIPRCISRDIKITGTDAVGASDGNKYWLSLKEENGEYALYVYDINYGIWHKEDNTHAISFVMLGGEMYMAAGTEVYNLNAPQESVDWEFELWYDEGTHLKKKYKEFHIRGNVGACEFFLKADDEEWRLIEAAQGKLSVRIPPIECEELSVLIKGKGICEIKSLDRVFEVN